MPDTELRTWMAALAKVVDHCMCSACRDAFIDRITEGLTKSPCGQRLLLDVPTPPPISRVPHWHSN